MLKKYGLVFLALIALAGCAAGPSPLQRSDGLWRLSYEATLAANPELQAEIKQNPQLAESLSRDMAGLGLKIDVQNHKITTLNLADNEVEAESPFQVISESPEEGGLLLEVQGSQFSIYLEGNTLEWREEGEILVFVRME